jgi:levansucrase
MFHAPAAVLAASAIVLALDAQASSLAEDRGTAEGVFHLAQADAGADREDAAGGETYIDPTLAAADQSDFATPEAFRFDGAMASVWSRQMVEAINQDIHVTLPLMIHPQEYFDEGTYVWDAWPIRNLDGSVAEFDGWVVMVALSSTWAEVEETGEAFYTLSELRYWYTRDGDWRPGGTIFSRQDGLGSRQWAGSAFHDAETGEVTFYYTAVGDPDAPSLEEDPPPGPVSIFNEAIGRPSTVQRLASATATVAVTDDGLAFENVGNHRIIGEADGFWYDTYETYLASEAVYGFRDPEYWRNPATGEEHVLFTGNAAGVPGPYNGAVGLMTRNDEGDWELEPPILISTGVNSQLERPHVVTREDGLYLFFSTHDFTFSPEVAGPRGLYGFRSASGSLRGRLAPLNEHALVAANPMTAPEQVYSFLVLPDGRVMSYLNILWGFAQRPEYDELEMFGGPAPMFQLALDGDTVTVAGTDADAAR